MPSIFSSTKSKSRHSTSHSTNPLSSIYDGRMSFSSDSSTLLNVDIPSYPTKTPPKYAQVIEEEMLDPEDQAWGPPPPSSYKWSLPKFSRKKQSRT